ncbi:hypothetical protein BJV78DRAFT_555996 [Lactifluus subvellereus]|nr:hypothetical protein BJV78DRAFT_555996 [Lactifluus subvellereus]
MQLLLIRKCRPPQKDSPVGQSNRMGHLAILGYLAPHPPHRSETLLVDLLDANWTTAILRELRVSMASWVLDNRSGLVLITTYGDVGCLVVRPDPPSTMKTFVCVGNIAPTPINVSQVLWPLHAKMDSHLGGDDRYCQIDVPLLLQAFLYLMYTKSRRITLVRRARGGGAS